MSIKELLAAAHARLYGTDTPPAAATRKPVAHDFFHRYWGHDYNWKPDPGSGGKTGSAVGWCDDIHVGDFILMHNTGSAPEMRASYRVVTIRYELDPSDMWWATLEYDPSGLDIANAAADAKGEEAKCVHE